MRKEEINVSKKVLEKIQRKVNRNLELEQGRQSYNRVHKSKVAYKREKYKKVMANDFD
jgi:hypothetical protein